MSCQMCQMLSEAWMNDVQDACSDAITWTKFYLVNPRTGDWFRQTDGSPLEYTKKEAFFLHLKYGWKVSLGRFSLEWIKGEFRRKS